MRNLKKAFTLVEILIVVVILGILASIVVPQFTNATEDAQVGNLRAQIRTVQDQIELFKGRTNAYPTLAALNANPTTTSETNGWGVLIDGGYIRRAPKNPAAPAGFQSVVVAGVWGPCPAGASAGWSYDFATGTLGATYYDENTDTLTPGTP
jgi:general secretion pathway protein G